jgi:hypothetical protein
MRTLASQLSSTLMQLLFSFDRGMRVEETLMQTLASQLSSTLMQLLFSFDRGMRVEKTLMQTLAFQLLSTLQGLTKSNLTYSIPIFSSKQESRTPGWTQSKFNSNPCEMATSRRWVCSWHTAGISSVLSSNHPAFNASVQ